MMWPFHCVQGSWGAEFHKDFEMKEEFRVFSKGLIQNVESYSGFGSHPEDTGLRDYLEEISKAGV